MIKLSNCVNITRTPLYLLNMYANRKIMGVKAYRYHILLKDGKIKN